MNLRNTLAVSSNLGVAMKNDGGSTSLIGEDFDIFHSSRGPLRGDTERLEDSFLARPTSGE